MLNGYEQILADIDRVEKANLSGQTNLFGGRELESEPEDYVLADLPEFDRSELLKMEKETTGFYVSGHPMLQYAQLLRELSLPPISEALAAGEAEGPYTDNMTLRLAGIITGKSVKTTRSDERMAFITLEDMTGSIEVVIFPKVLSHCGHLLNTDSALLIRGRLSLREDEAPKLICEELGLLERCEENVREENNSHDEDVSCSEACDGGETLSEGLQKSGFKRPGLYLRMDNENCPRLDWAHKYMALFEGDTPVYLYFQKENRLVQVPRKSWIEPNEVLLRELAKLLGVKNVVHCVN